MVSISSSLFPRLAVLAVWLGVVSGAGCCVIDGTCGVDGEALGIDEGAAPENSRGESNTPGCATDAIRVSGDVVCASCDFGDEDICGEAEVATCEARQNSQGDTCQLCITPSGAILYDDCFTGNELAADAAFCEPTPGRQEGEACSTCFDSFGSAVSTSCAPETEGCADFTADDGRACSACATASGADFTVCESVDIDPDFCRAYENDVGRCVDCFDNERGLLSHTCSPREGVRVCEERVVDGLICSVCFNDSGFVVEQSCAGGVPQIERCEQLVFSEQTCVVCVDGKGDVAVVDCAANACFDAGASVVCRSDADCNENEACFDGACVPRVGDDTEGAPPLAPEACAVPSCSMNVNADGVVCRSCPTSDGDVEVRCLGGSPLRCEFLPEDSLAPPPTDEVGEDNLGEAERPDAAPQGRTCVLCADEAGAEVYRDCEGNGAVPPPYCTDVLTDTNDVCTVCFDAVTNAPVYTSCDEQSCYDRTETELADLDGVALSVGGDIAVASCQTCNDGTDINTSCQLQQTCANNLVADPTSCEGGAELRIRPRVCENPWEAYRRSASRRDDLAGLMAFSIDRHQLVVQAATTTPDTPQACAVDDCSCARGDIVTLVVADADAAAAAFGDLVVRE
jgi:hypothetical protein